MGGRVELADQGHWRLLRWPNGSPTAPSGAMTRGLIKSIRSGASAFALWRARISLKSMACAGGLGAELRALRARPFRSRPGRCTEEPPWDLEGLLRCADGPATLEEKDRQVDGSKQ